MSQKNLRYGYTTGACAAAAAKGAAEMLRDQRIIEMVEITLPSGDTVRFPLRGQTLLNGAASCYVVKNAGDDPDVTHGVEVHAQVSIEFFTPHRIMLEGGIGIGRVTKPGLAVPVGEWAINPVPRRMVLEGVKEVFAMRCLPATLTITLSIPDGAERAKKTLNERLGIVGGLSILGTTGIVKPLSHKAWADTIDTAVDVALACGSEAIVLSTGRTSEMAAQKFFGTRTQTSGIKDAHPDIGHKGFGNGENLRDEAFVMMGDHVGHAVRACADKGVRKLVIAGQFAKLLKIACGNEQTHASSAELDLRMLFDWIELKTQNSKLKNAIRQAHTAREVLVSSGGDPDLIALVCGKVREFAERIAPKVEVRVLLAGYGREVLFYG
jgi:cobalt-precorrin-5B (C1)-methyltransferase